MSNPEIGATLLDKSIESVHGGQRGLGIHVEERYASEFSIRGEMKEGICFRIDRRTSYPSSSKSAFASCRSLVSKPSVNQS